MEPRDYDREFCRAGSGPVRTRVGYDSEKGRIPRFVVQMEYHLDGEWQPVVRYDHDGTSEAEQAHDVSEEGFHIDIFRDGEKHATEFIAPPMSGATALNRVEDHLANNLERFTTRFKQWHGIEDR